MGKERDLDIVVFGASGFTGGLVAQYLAQHEGPLRWALAGRDAQKLERVRSGLQTRGNAPEVVIADASDAAALTAMVRRTRVVLTTVGPYIRYGEPLVAACAEAGTHYVDLTGEPPFVALTRARYHDVARRSGAKIVHACGFDSIPHDIGAYFTVKTLRSRLPEAERASTPISLEGVVRAGGTFSGGTWHSALEIMSTLRTGTKQLRAVDEHGETRTARALPRKVRFDRELGLWLVPMPTIDPLVVLQSARTLPEYGPDFRYGHFLGLKRLVQVVGLTAGVGTVFALAQWKPTRSLLEKVKLPGEGPDEATREKGWFRVTFTARAGGEQVRCEVRGGDPGYGDTSKMISEAALSLALDRARLPDHGGGVLTPAVAMGDVLLERLPRAGISFTVK
jgi:short subunit dehydrogenase-like uncharacterized protein